MQTFAFARAFALSRAINGDASGQPSAAFGTAQTIAPPASCRRPLQSIARQSGVAPPETARDPEKSSPKRTLRCVSQKKLNPLSDGYRPDASGKRSSRVHHALRP